MSSTTDALHLTLIVALVSLQNMSFCVSCRPYFVVSLALKRSACPQKFLQIVNLLRDKKVVSSCAGGGKISRNIEMTYNHI